MNVPINPAFKDNLLSFSAKTDSSFLSIVHVPTFNVNNVGKRKYNISLIRKPIDYPCKNDRCLLVNKYNIWHKNDDGFIQLYIKSLKCYKRLFPYDKLPYYNIDNELPFTISYILIYKLGSLTNGIPFLALIANRENELTKHNKYKFNKVVAVRLPFFNNINDKHTFTLNPILHDKEDGYISLAIKLLDMYSNLYPYDKVPFVDKNVFPQ